LLRERIEEGGGGEWNKLNIGNFARFV